MAILGCRVDPEKLATLSLRVKPAKTGCIRSQSWSYWKLAVFTLQSWFYWKLAMQVVDLILLRTGYTGCRANLTEKNCYVGYRVNPTKKMAAYCRIDPATNSS